jgi:hypothetical protein
MVLHMLAGVDNPAVLDNVSPQKILVLGYKNFGHGQRFKERHDETVAAGIGQ